MRIKREDILYEDKEIIVCHKRAGAAVQTARLGETDMETELKSISGRLMWRLCIVWTSRWRRLGFCKDKESSRGFGQAEQRADDE